MMKNKHILQTCLGMLCTGAVLPVLAQNAGEYEGLEATGFSTKFVVTAGLGHRAESDVDGGAKSSMTSFRVAGGTAMVVNEKTSFSFLGSYTFNHYDFKDVLADPWEDIHTVRLTPLMQYRIDDHWSVYGGPSVGISAEDGADIGDAFTFGGLAGFNYRANPQLIVGLGLGVYSQIEDDVRVFPVPTARWNFAERWVVSLGYSEVAANGGLGAEVGYDLTEKWKLAGGLQFQRRRFRLDDDNVPRDGVGEDRSLAIYAKAVWQLNENCALEGLVGVSAAGEYRIEDEDGHKLGDTDYDPSALFGLRGVFSF